MKFSTSFLLHCSAFLALVLPAVLIRLSKNENVVPVLNFASDFSSGLIDLLVYRGRNAPPRENRDLDEFVPEVTEENVLNKALSYVQKQDKGNQFNKVLTMS